ncbi:predicted protein [Nematostella vectensis]|uniref:Reverse transcriptase domain-containing protein n=1 Tax=Nematostella vectensis TaxID=45351 RepID=A7S0X8_NEMVE|nr:predicted protein [Nematostella vectensis]|eukprot:XP_001634724.1 predicted protein [Nematostella vectensis]
MPYAPYESVISAGAAERSRKRVEESWLKPHIPDDFVSISGYNIIRLDRESTEHGGVCMYVRDHIRFKILTDIMDDNFEVLWVQIWLPRLPRGIQSIIIGTVYHPPSSSDPLILAYLHESMSIVEAQFTDCGVILLGDYNKLGMTRIKNAYGVKQIVPFPTRGNNKLDLVFTDLSAFYEVPIKRPPFGLSDHDSVEVQPVARQKFPDNKVLLKSRDLRSTKRVLLCRSTWKKKQRVKLGQDCLSEWGVVPAGVPQGKKLGPWLFIAMINDLDIADTELWKYVDDTTISETVPKSKVSTIQAAVDSLASSSASNKFQLNESKCKEMRISFSTSDTYFDPIVVNEVEIEKVSCAKILGLHISCDLKWNDHIDDIITKCKKRMFGLRQLKRSGLGKSVLVSFFRTCVRPITEYACPVYHDNLSKCTKFEAKVPMHLLKPPLVLPALHYQYNVNICLL